MADQQLPFDFESHHIEARAWLTSALKLAEATEKERAVVELVYRITRENGGPLRWTLAAIGAEFGRDRQTIRRWIAAATAKGLLAVDPQKHVAGGQRPHLLTIDWESVRRLACRREAGGKRDQRGDGAPRERPATISATSAIRSAADSQDDAKARNRGIKACAEPPYQNPRAPYQNTPALGDSDTPIRNNYAFTKPTEIPPPTPADCASRAAASWAGVGEELLRLGMATGRSVAARLARTAMTPDDARRLIEAWRQAGGGTPSAAWGVGALHDRLAAWQPGQDPRALWPPPCDAHAADQARRRRLADGERIAAETLRRRAEHAERVRQVAAERSG